ncbi:MAG: RING finger domain-containing protein [Candidatus Babeliales bacterium]|nr:RING finger domain-containing protein [Candidatus Babeliales bacterium]
MIFKKLFLALFASFAFYSATPTLPMENSSNLSALVSTIRNKEKVKEIFKTLISNLTLNDSIDIKKGVLSGTLTALIMIFFGTGIGATNNSNHPQEFKIGMILIKIFTLVKLLYTIPIEKRPTNRMLYEISQSIGIAASWVTLFIFLNRLVKFHDDIDNYVFTKHNMIKLYLKYKQMIKNAEINIEEICSICRENNDANSVTLLCDHQFHKDCIKSWLIQNFICPTCRHKFDV